MKQKNVYVGALDRMGSGVVLDLCVYDSILIEEAAAGTEPSSLSAVTRTQNLCFVGDQKQLPRKSDNDLVKRELIHKLVVVARLRVSVDLHFGGAIIDILRTCRHLLH